jgi:hypothetical protein
MSQRYKATIKLELGFNASGDKKAIDKVRSFLIKTNLLSQHFGEYSISWNGKQKLERLPF